MWEIVKLCASTLAVRPDCAGPLVSCGLRSSCVPTAEQLPQSCGLPTTPSFHGRSPSLQASATPLRSNPSIHPAGQFQASDLRTMVAARHLLWVALLLAATPAFGERLYMQQLCRQLGTACSSDCVGVRDGWGRHLASSPRRVGAPCSLAPPAAHAPAATTTDSAPLTPA